MLTLYLITYVVQCNSILYELILIHLPYISKIRKQQLRQNFQLKKE